MSVKANRWAWSTAISIPLRYQSHINVLEMRMYLSAVEWRLRRCSNQGTRFLHLLDSQVCLGVAAKGRSSSHQLNRLCRRLCALLMAGELYPLLAYVATDENPADEPSRRHDQTA